MATAPTGSPFLRVDSLDKRFPGVHALRGVSFALHPGEVVAVVGENGAGKSTLMKILAGVQPADTGTITMDGVAVTMDSVRDGLQRGVALIHQELNLADNLDIGANLFLGREPSRLGVIDEATITARSRDLLSRVGLDLPPSTLVGSLTIGHQQMVEIAKALSIDARLLIMDEPTSSLSHGESERLFEVIRRLRAQGVCVLYISHRLGEVIDLADRVLVMRDGQLVGELADDQIEHDTMVRMMIGRDLSSFYEHREHPRGRVMLEVTGLRTAAYPDREVSFEVHAGEVVGVAGLVGAGRSDVLAALFGAVPKVSGCVRVDGRETTIRAPIDAIDAGLALVPEDRKSDGLVLQMTVRENSSLASLKRASRLGWLDRADEARVTAEAISALSIKAESGEQVVRFLSGGNQQKVVLGRWLALHPKVLLLDEPTRGVDIGAKREIYHLMEALAERGVAVLFVSSEMEEVLGMADRAIVMHEGRITGELDRADLSEEAIMRLATGGAAA